MNGVDEDDEDDDDDALRNVLLMDVLMKERLANLAFESWWSKWDLILERIYF